MDTKAKTSCTTESLFLQLQGRIGSFIASKVDDEETAKDLTQEVFVKTLQFCHRGGACSFPKSFLYRAAVNVVADHFRTSKKRKSVEVRAGDSMNMEMPDSETGELNIEREFAECLMAMIDHIPSPYREAVLWADIENLSQQEIAKRMNVSLSGAKSRVQRGREKVRDLLAHVCELHRNCRGEVVSCEERR